LTFELWGDDIVIRIKFVGGEMSFKISDAIEYPRSNFTEDVFLFDHIYVHSQKHTSVKGLANIYIIIDSLKEIMETGQRFLGVKYRKPQATTHTIIGLSGT
jgi:hypothetical protein